MDGDSQGAEQVVEEQLKGFVIFVIQVLAVISYYPVIKKRY